MGTRSKHTVNTELLGFGFGGSGIDFAVGMFGDDNTWARVESLHHWLRDKWYKCTQEQDRIERELNAQSPVGEGAERYTELLAEHGVTVGWVEALRYIADLLADGLDTHE